MSTSRADIIAKYIESVEKHTSTSNTLKSTRIELVNYAKIAKNSDKLARSVQTVGLTIAEVVRRITEHKYIVKTSHGPRYIVNIKVGLECTFGMRVALDVTTLTIMQILPREVDPLVYKMSKEDPGTVDFKDIGGLSEQVRKLREVVELPLKNPELFKRVGITPPKGVLLYGPPGTGKTLMARALASTLDVTFLKIVSSAVIEKYIGESARTIREMFTYARENQPCIIFMDEIDAIGGKRSNELSSTDREVQRTLMELLAQMDGFHELDRVKIIMATNRPDILDEALLRPGRLDRKVEIPLPNDTGRREILQIHAKKLRTEGLDDELMDTLINLSAGFNGADLRNICTEAGMNAIRDERDYICSDDFVKAVRKIGDVKKLESKFDYKKR